VPNIGTMKEFDCINAGGTPVNCRLAVPYDMFGKPNKGGPQICDCIMPDAKPASVPTSITVSPTITTQVSPQVSPVFQQQFQPTNSPATAGTAQTTAASVPAPQQLSPAPTPAPSYSVPQYQAPAPQYQAPAPQYQAPAPAPEQLPVSPLPDQTNTSGSSVPVTAVSQGTAITPVFDWKIAAIIGVGLVAAMALSDNRKR
jgi:hypothetical protein